ncbi:DNA primase regulatory subunit PriL [Methanofollis formosanus]|uniref:DNA primase large subunit PriL n=1 Tax=Methanofollis formosanus TaxID=299308 RepID=A0A8G1EEX8_9EURY|nr:DNA primase regulatory subunit PriL [Methanofollis formosanus]QYZ78360.1 DNA primase regulatory subunit PriL [Methanofollis formosanus]
MGVDLERNHLARYPFLQESQTFARDSTDSIETFLESEIGKIVLPHAVARAKAALFSDPRDQDKDESEPPFKVSIFSYVIARILVSCTKDRMMADRLARYEAARAAAALQREDPAIRAHVAQSLGIDLDARTIPVTTYVELVARLRDDHWRLVNREVREGMVAVGTSEMAELLRERIRVVVGQNLPLDVPASLCDTLKPYTDELAAALREKTLEEFGEVDETSFPPCIAALITAVTAGTNLTHMGRFALTAFLHNIGLSTEQIAEVFQRAPDFDLSMTMYQVEHISGRSGTEYTPPSCATMRTYGICVHKNALCELVSHPLSYYRRKKQQQENQKKK